MRLRRGLLLLLLAAASPAVAQNPLPQMFDVSQLARFRPVTIGMFSSYERTGLNDDGFSGKHSFLRKEGDGLVIAELEGPGALTRIWTPTPIDAPIEFYIDDETRPRIALPFTQLFSGTQAPFTGPLVGRGVGGYWSYVPIEFQRSVKVIMRAPKLQFYQINYALYPKGSRGGGAPPAFRHVVQGRPFAAQHQLVPGGSATLFEVAARAGSPRFASAPPAPLPATPARSTSA